MRAQYVFNGFYVRQSRKKCFVFVAVFCSLGMCAVWLVCNTDNNNSIILLLVPTWWFVFAKLTNIAVRAHCTTYVYKWKTFRSSASMCVVSLLFWALLLLHKSNRFKWQWIFDFGLSIHLVQKHLHGVHTCCESITFANRRHYVAHRLQCMFAFSVLCVFDRDWSPNGNCTRQTTWKAICKPGIDCVGVAMANQSFRNETTTKGAPVNERRFSSPRIIYPTYRNVYSL